MWHPIPFFCPPQYAETPQYLRKKLFPMHPSLRLAGLLNPLDSPHHMREDDDCPFREGVVVDRDVKKGAGSFVDIGKRKVGGCLYSLFVLDAVNLCMYYIFNVFRVSCI